jgi:hypothetical protein
MQSNDVLFVLPLPLRWGVHSALQFLNREMVNGQFSGWNVQLLEMRDH